MALIGCSLVNDPDRDLITVDGVVAAGSCMCSWCLDRRFCQSREDPDDIVFTDPCPDGFAEAIEATSLLPDGTRSDPFFCIPPGSRDLNNDGETLCPVGERRSRVEWVNMCLDTPVCSRVGVEFADCEVRADPTDTCRDEYSGPRRAVCAAAPSGSITDGIPVAREKLADKCSFHGLDVPSGPLPERYCFLSCVQDIGTEDRECDPRFFDPPQVRHSSMLVDLDPLYSTVRVEVDIEDDPSAHFNVDGFMAVSVGPQCVGQAEPGTTEVCEAEVPFVYARSTNSGSIGGQEIRDLTVINTQPSRGTVTNGDFGGMVELPDPEVFFGSATFPGIGRRGSPSVPLSGLHGTLQWEDGQFVMTSDLTGSSGQNSASISLRGDIVSLPPRAEAGGDRTVECNVPGGASVVLSTAGSTDPDGTEDLAYFMWSGRRGLNPFEISGRHTTLTLPLGSTHLELQVTDRSGLTDLDHAVVTVQDTVGPEIGDVDVATECLWGPDHSMHLFRLGREIRATAFDDCDDAPVAVRIADVRSNEPADTTGDGATDPDVRYGNGAFCVRSERRGDVVSGRRYTVVLEAADSSGNLATKEVDLRVPHDQRPALRCDSMGLTPVVPDDDPRCETDVPDSAGAVSAAAPVELADAGASGATPSGGCAVGSTTRGGVPWVLMPLALLAWRLRRTDR